MRKILVLAGMCAVGLVGVAQADKPPHPSHPAHPAHPSHPATPSPKSCAPRAVGYNARGTLVAATLTPATTGHDRFSGTLAVNVTNANHHATTGSQSFTLTGAHVVFHHGVDVTAPAAGSRVGLHGKITVLPKDCATTGFSPTITIHGVDIRVAKS
ncbi:MAG TPA: hypothetical protein VG294_18480 [Solirubrobacteraceae bacterium]|jgi:hypothetical protein|nr:hypothetical protein [Solirubrobacteraceae bacterium]